MSEPTNTYDYPSRAATDPLRPIAAALVAAWVDYCDADDNGWTERREQLADHIDGLMGQLREVIA